MRTEPRQQAIHAQKFGGSLAMWFLRYVSERIEMLITILRLPRDKLKLKLAVYREMDREERR